MEAPPARRSVCVTGAGGFIASWLVKLLLSRGDYVVNGTVRDRGNGKNAYLKALENSGERLHLLKADLLDNNSVVSAVAGCEGVFHVASPVPSGRPLNPEEWYFLSKTLAERQAFAYAARTELDIVTICPSLVIGPLMQSTVNTSIKIFLSYFKEDCETVENRLRNLVDVCDVADALVLAYENSEAYGRYVCSSTPIKVSDMVNILKTLYPTNTYPKNSMEVEDILQKFFGAFGEDIISHSMEVEVEDIISYSKKLGWTFRPAEETVRDSIESYRAFGVQVWLLHLQPLADSCK